MLQPNPDDYTINGALMPRFLYRCDSTGHEKVLNENAFPTGVPEETITIHGQRYARVRQLDKLEPYLVQQLGFSPSQEGKEIPMRRQQAALPVGLQRAIEKPEPLPANPGAALVLLGVGALIGLLCGRK